MNFFLMSFFAHDDESEDGDDVIDVQTDSEEDADDPAALAAEDVAGDEGEEEAF